MDRASDNQVTVGHMTIPEATSFWQQTSVREEPFLSSLLFKKHARANSLLRIFPTPANCNCLTASIQHFLFFKTLSVAFLWFGTFIIFYNYGQIYVYKIYAILV